jgi:hypothetical protein
LLLHWLDDRHEARLRVARRRRRAAKAWSSSIVNKLVCGASIALLAPAIFAVWVAIKRSSPARSTVRLPDKSVIGPRVQAAKPAMLLTIKPALICAPQRGGTMNIAASRAMSA